MLFHLLLPHDPTLHWVGGGFWFDLPLTLWKEGRPAKLVVKPWSHTEPGQPGLTLLQTSVSPSVKWVEPLP